MKEEGYGDYSESFEKNKVDGSVLVTIDLNSLKELSMDLVGIRIKLVFLVFDFNFSNPFLKKKKKKKKGLLLQLKH